jgi:hypothetical protein
MFRITLPTKVVWPFRPRTQLTLTTEGQGGVVEWQQFSGPDALHPRGFHLVGNTLVGEPKARGSFKVLLGATDSATNESANHELEIEV